MRALGLLHGFLIFCRNSEVGGHPSMFEGLPLLMVKRVGDTAGVMLCRLVSYVVSF